jgi:PAS domain S-box-containing protein
MYTSFQVVIGWNMKRLSEMLDSPGNSLEQIGKPRRKALLISMMILFLLLMPLLWYASFWCEDMLIKELKTHNTIGMNIHGNALTTMINKRFALLEGLFAFIIANPSDEYLKKNFDVFASGLYSGAKGIRNFALAPGGVQRYVYPFRGNELTLGHDLINDPRPEVRVDILRAINTRKIAISGPYELRQGGLGLVARKALYVNDTFWGLITMAIDMPPILEEAAFYSKPSDIEMALQGSSGNIFWGNSSVFENEPLKLRIELPEGYWELGVIPSGGWRKAVADKLLEFQAAGLVFSILIAITIYLLISRYSLLDERNEYLKQSYQNLKQEITERKRAEEALRESEQKYRDVFNATSDALGIHDETGKFLDVNERMCAMFECDRLTALGLSLNDISLGVSPYSEAEALEKVRKSIEEGPQVFEWLGRRSSGEIFWSEVALRAYRIGGEMCVVTSARDISDRKRAEQRYRDLFESSKDGIVHTNIQGRIQDANTAYIDMLGYSKEELKLLTYQQLTPSKWHNTEDEIVRNQIMSRGYSDEYEKEYVKKDGTIFPITLRTWLIEDEEGKPSGMWGVVRDITERKRAEEALFESENKFKSFAEQALVGIYLIQDGVFKYVNPKFAQMFGYTVEECLNDMPFKILVYAEDLTLVDERVRKRISGEVEFVQYTFRGVKKNGQIFHVEIHGSTSVHKGRLAATGTILDITERKRVEEERLQLTQRLHQVLKAESLARMAGAIAHHFNNMLGAVIGNLELAMGELPHELKSHTWVAQAMKASNRAAEISHSMLAYLGQTTSRRELIDLTDVTSEALLFVGASLPKKTHLELNLPSEELKILGDATHIRQILTNLVLNASEAIGEQEGFITVAIHAVVASDILESKFFPLDWKPVAKSYACVSVSDTGCGMDAAIQDKIFDPFFSTKFTGRGLGLAVAMGLVQAHDGAIAIESQGGWGSSFRLYLPISGLQALSSKKEEAIISEMIEGQGLILLVEDEPMVRNMAEAMLKRLGYEVITACDGSEAVGIFRERKDEFGLVLLDLSMPRMGGWETLNALRALRPEVPVVLASGYDEAKVMEGRQAELLQAFLHKPYRMVELKAALDAVIVTSAKRMKPY